MTATYKFDYCIDRVAEGIDEHNPIYARLWLKRAKEAHDADIENDASAAIMLTEAIESNTDSHGGRTPETWIGDTIGQAVTYGDYNKEADDVANNFDFDSIDPIVI